MSAPARYWATASRAEQFLLRSVGTSRMLARTWPRPLATGRDDDAVQLDAHDCSLGLRPPQHIRRRLIWRLISSAQTTLFGACNAVSPSRTPRTGRDHLVVTMMIGHGSFGGTGIASRKPLRALVPGGREGLSGQRDREAALTSALRVTRQPGTGHAGGVVAVSPVLVGRAAEIAVLGESWALARDGSPATVLIGGEAGIGKTRLVKHFTADLEAEVLYGGCVDLSGGGLPFAPFTAALRGHADPPADLLPWGVQADSETARARLLRRCSHSSPACARGGRWCWRSRTAIGLISPAWIC